MINGLIMLRTSSVSASAIYTKKKFKRFHDFIQTPTHYRLKKIVYCTAPLYVFYSLKANDVSFESMFEEIPIVIKNSHLVNCLLCDLEEQEKSDIYQHLDLATGYVLLR